MHLKRTPTGYSIANIQSHLGRGLSPRETQAVACYAADMTQPEIALTMHCSVSNIKQLIRNAHFKMGTYRPNGLISAAYAKGVIGRALLVLLVCGNFVNDNSFTRTTRNSRNRCAAQHQVQRANRTEYTA